MAAYWLVKTEPEEWSYNDQDKQPDMPWTGVKNPQAQSYMRQMALGDLVFFYHTGKEKAIVGLCRISSNPYLDPDDPKKRAVLITLKTVKKAPKPVSLAQVKGDARFAQLGLVRQSRLSVMPIDPVSFKSLCEMAGL